MTPPEGAAAQASIACQFRRAAPTGVAQARQVTDSIHRISTHHIRVLMIVISSRLFCSGLEILQNSEHTLAVIGMSGIRTMTGAGRRQVPRLITMASYLSHCGTALALKASCLSADFRARIPAFAGAAIYLAVHSRSGRR